MIKAAPSFNGLKTAAVNGHHFANIDEGLEILKSAEQEARRKGYETLIGPMDNGSWGPYRLVMYSDGSPSFVGEPQSGVYDLEAYIKAGFIIGEMHSSAKANISNRTEPTKHIKNLKMTAWDGKNPEKLLKDVHRITMTAFAKTPLFSPIPANDFIQAYIPILKRADPRLLLSAMNENGEMVAYLLSYPDPNWPKTLIVKTYAATEPGAGRYLMEQILWRGKNYGFEQAVFGLMRDGNYSTSALKRFDATIFRRYALMEKRL